MNKDKAEKWADGWLNPQELEKLGAKFNDVWMNSQIKGERIFIKDGVPYTESEFILEFESFGLVDSVVVTEDLSASEVIDKYSGYLTEEQLQKLKSYEK
jgi:hypothetical protein